MKLKYILLPALRRLKDNYEKFQKQFFFKKIN